MNNAQIFKVDRITVRNGGRSPLLICNYNIPAFRLDLASADRVRDTIEEDFGATLQHVSYSISATYLLRHRVTDEEKYFAGSFHARGQQFGQLAEFRNFNNNEFSRHVLERSAPAVLDHRLRRQARQTAWEFHQLVSIVVSAQAPQHAGVGPRPAQSILG